MGESLKGTLMEGVIGYYEKRDCPGGRFICEGKARLIRMEGEIGVYLFTPYEACLYSVEATLEL